MSASTVPGPSGEKVRAFEIGETPAQYLAKEILDEVKTILNGVPKDSREWKLNGVEFKLHERQHLDIQLADGRSISFSIWGRKKLESAHV